MQSVCLCCDWIRHHYGHLSAEYLSLLDQMFEDKVRFMNETIFQITKLFDGNMKAVSPDKKHERRLKLLQDVE
ncbi:unnamed protein product [Coregonus sp. 'balchen']|nr:unnamed protein product [Coregonus sp. 'balchen']